MCVLPTSSSLTPLREKPVKIAPGCRNFFTRRYEPDPLSEHVQSCLDHESSVVYWVGSELVEKVSP